MVAPWWCARVGARRTAVMMMLAAILPIPSLVCVYDRTIEHSRFMCTSMWSSPLEPLHLPKSTLYVFGSNLLILLMWIWICRKRRISSYIWLTCLFSNIDYDKFFKPNSGLHFGSGSYQCVCVCRNRLLIIQNYAQVAKIIAFDDCVSIELGKKKEKRKIMSVF